MTDEQVLHQQLLRDLEHLHELILRYAHGDSSAKQERDRLDREIQLERARWVTLLKLVDDTNRKPVV